MYEFPGSHTSQLVDFNLLLKTGTSFRYTPKAQDISFLPKKGIIPSTMV
jgi:hypothetical protein